MAKLTLADVANLLGNPTSAANTINANNALVETALENTLSRDGTTPNQMEADIDMNNNDLLNVGTINVEDLILNGVPVQEVELADALKITNNLSDVESVAESVQNLGLGIRPTLFDATAGTGGDDTVAVQAAIDYVNTNGGLLDLTGTWRVTKIDMGSTNTFFEVQGIPTFVGIASTPQDCIVEITRGNFNITGGMIVFGQYSTNYTSGYWIHNDTQVQFADLDDFNAVGCQIGIRFGDATQGGSITSEMTLKNPRTFGCPVALQVEGGNAYLTVIAGVLSGDNFGGSGSWLTFDRHAVINKGSSVTVLGGEVIQTASGAVADHLVEIQPSLWDGDLVWGRSSFIGVTMESGGPLCKIHNPGALAGAVPADKAQFLVNSCVGFHSQDNAPFISAIAAYPGDIVWSNNNFWFPGTRTEYNIECAGNDCNVYVDDRGFGNGFMGPIAGTLGGVAHFSKRVIFQAIGLPAVALGAGANTLLWQSFVADDDNLRYQGFYVAGTGTFTVPTGGLRNMRIRAQAYATGVTGYMVIRVGGTEVARGPFAEAGSVIYEDNTVAAGGAVTVDLVVTGGAGALPSASDFLNTFVVEALN